MEQKEGKSKKTIIIVVLIAAICILSIALAWAITGGTKSTSAGGQQTVTPAPTEDVSAVQETKKPAKETQAPKETETASPEETAVPEEAQPTKEPVVEEPEETKEPEPSKEPQQEGMSALHVEGTWLCDEQGNPVQLRGISTHGMAWFPQYINEECFQQFKEEWKANVVRLAMYTHENGGYCTDGNKDDLKQLVKNGVEYATENDLYVIIDWHVLQDQNPNTYKEEAKKFFKEMSELYKDYPNVIYEICNEPNGGVGWKDIKSYAEEVIGVIRENDKDNVIIVGTPNWSQYVDQAAADPITKYDNIMYALHFYAATHTDNLRTQMKNAVANGLPIFVSEYGICDASGNGGIDYNQAQAWVEAMDELGISYIAWNLSNKNETSAILKSSCSKTSGFTQDDLSDSGKWLYSVLTEHAGGSGAGSSSEDNKEEKPAETPKPTEPPKKEEPSSVADGTVEATLTVGDSWESNGKKCYNYSVTITNISDSAVNGWKVKITFSDSIALNQGWSGVYTVNGNVLEIASVDYNGKLEPGQSISDIGFIIEGSASLKVVE